MFTWEEKMKSEEMKAEGEGAKRGGLGSVFSFSFYLSWFFFFGFERG